MRLPTSEPNFRWTWTGALLLALASACQLPSPKVETCPAGDLFVSTGSGWQCMPVPAGMLGGTGAMGAAGVNGATGTAGPVGARGATGVPGISGPTGATGIAGLRGAIGAPGTNGTAGAKGATGAPGPAGVPGTGGATGTGGPMGATGATGPAGFGAVGATGPTGPTGDINVLLPPGTVIAFAGLVGGVGAVAPPSGWLFCGGSAVDRTTYANLYAAIGTTYGVGDGATTFNLPDYRGVFLRGLDQGAGNDPDRSDAGAVGSVEGYDIQSHSHATQVTDPGHSHASLAQDPGGDVLVSSGGTCEINYVVPLFGGNCIGEFPGTTSTVTTGISVGVNATGGDETRPINVAVNYLIKY